MLIQMPNNMKQLEHRYNQSIVKIREYYSTQRKQQQANRTQALKYEFARSSFWQKLSIDLKSANDRASQLKNAENLCKTETRKGKEVFEQALNALTQKNKTLKKKLENNLKARENLMARIKELEVELETVKKDGQEERDELIRKLAEARAKAAVLENSNAGLKAELELVKEQLLASTTKNKEMQTSIETLTKEKTELKTRGDKLQAILIESSEEENKARLATRIEIENLKRKVAQAEKQAAKHEKRALELSEIVKNCPKKGEEVVKTEPQPEVKPEEVKPVSPEETKSGE